MKPPANESPAPVGSSTDSSGNAGAMKIPDPQGVEQTFRRRIDQVFALAATSGYRALILGAWGCGAHRPSWM